MINKNVVHGRAIPNHSNATKEHHMTIYRSPQCSCIICRKQYSIYGIHTHYERTHGTDEQKAKYSDGYNGHYHLEEFKDKLRSPREEITKECEWCRKEFTYTKIVTHPERRTCSKSCAVSIANSENPVSWTSEMREAHSIISKKLWEDEDYAKKVLNNNRHFTSKNEVLIRDYFIDNFSEDEWTFGGHLRIQNEGITRDLYSNKLKICFEYDGVWHFEDIHGQLAKKQLKDKLLEQWCINNKYTLVRLDEKQFNSDSIPMLRELFYSITEPSVIKIGDRY